MSNIAPPFTCQYSPQIPELLHALQCSIAISTYQAGKVVFISPKDRQSLVQLPRNFKSPMGIAVDGNRLAIADQSKVTIFADDPELAKTYPKQPDTYDSMYLPRVSWHTGMVDLHDIGWNAQNELIAVNTLFSCVVKLSDSYSFEPVWWPSFISKLAAEDRCHLNGMAMLNGEAKYMTALGQSDQAQGWRGNITGGGILIDMQQQQVVASALAMPHSPKYYKNQLYFLQSAAGQLSKFDAQSGTVSLVKQFPSFVRGLAFHGDYAFIGMSKLRKSSSSFGQLKFSHEADQAGIIILHMPSNAIVGQISYVSSVEEIYDVQIIPDRIRPNILTTEKDEHLQALSIPGATFWSVEK
jgi:uncharacterized protein (TIGR03032 family)